MAYSYVEYTADGSTDSFSVTFDYISQDHVAVSVEGVDVTFTWDGEATVVLDATPGNGDVVRVYRETPIAPIVDFVDAGVMTEENLDLASTQTSMINAETRDYVDEEVELAATESVVRAENAADAAEAARDIAIASAAASLTEWRFGSGSPSGALGIDGDCYMDTGTDEVYHKESGVWVLKGDVTGATGPTGSTGAAGADGSTVLNGSGAPSGGTGADGDFYIDTTAKNIYGPKTGGAWGSGTSLIGPAGSGTGDVLGPASHAASYVPQWNTSADSKTLVEGFAITTAGKAILDDAAASDQRTTLGLGDSATKSVGTGAGDVAAGNHAHSGVYEPADADIVKKDVANSFSAAQRGSVSTLTDAATITPDFAVSNNFSVTLGGNRTMENPTNLVAGQSGIITITQDGSGGRTLAFGTYWDFKDGDVPVLTTTASAVDELAYYVRSANKITAALITALS